MKVLIIFIFCLIVSVFFKIVNNRFKKINKKNQEAYFSQLNIISPSISYDKFKKVAKKASVRNTPVRSQGDFVDFILPYVKSTTNSNFLENNLSRADCGDERNE